MIIATMPPAHCEDLTNEIASHPLVDMIRFNTGMVTPHSPRETLILAKRTADIFGKKLWLDLKGRQLRVKQWCAPNYGKIVLNHEVAVEGPARVHFRGSGWTNLKLANGNTIFVDPLPPQAIGAGQAINIVGESVNIAGYLTGEDKAYLTALQEVSVDAVLLSFVEKQSDLIEVIAQFMGWPGKLPTFGLKIESAKGLAFATSYFAPNGYFSPEEIDVFLILARDDLSNELGGGLQILSATEMIAKLDPQAVAASKFFPSLEKSGELSPADINDWHFLHQLGYKNFLLQDELSMACFQEAMAAIGNYQKKKGADDE